MKRYKEFINENVDYNKKLEQSSARGNLNGVKDAIKNGANINSNNGYPLQIASAHGHLNVVKYLVENGADIKIGNYFAIGAILANDLKKVNSAGTLMIDYHYQTRKYLVNKALEMEPSDVGKIMKAFIIHRSHTKEQIEEILEPFLEKHPYLAYEVITHLTDEQKQKYKEFIILGRDFDVFEGNIFNKKKILNKEEIKFVVDHIETMFRDKFSYVRHHSRGVPIFPFDKEYYGYVNDTIRINLVINREVDKNGHLIPTKYKEIEKIVKSELGCDFKIKCKIIDVDALYLLCKITLSDLEKAKPFIALQKDFDIFSDD